MTSKDKLVKKLEELGFKVFFVVSPDENHRNYSYLEVSREDSKPENTSMSGLEMYAPYSCWFRWIHGQELTAEMCQEIETNVRRVLE